MIRIIDQLFAGWAPHDIVWYSWCMMAGMILLVWAITAGIARRHRESFQSARYYTDPGQGRVSGDSYDIPLWEDDA